MSPDGGARHGEPLDERVALRADVRTPVVLGTDQPRGVILIDEGEGDVAHKRRLSAHLDAMLALCETIECRRGQLLNYFGQSSAACGNCDTCLSPPESWDGTVPAQKLLSTVVRLQRERNQRFGAGHLIDILTGTETDKVLGVWIIATVAGTMIAQAAQAMEFGATSEDIAYTCHAHPTHSEAMKEAAMAVQGKPIHV